MLLSFKFTLHRSRYQQKDLLVTKREFLSWGKVSMSITALLFCCVVWMLYEDAAFKQNTFFKTLKVGLYGLLWCRLLFLQNDKRTKSQSPPLHLSPRCLRLWMWCRRSVKKKKKKKDNHFSPLGRNISHQYASCSCAHFQHIIHGVTCLVVWTPPPSIKHLVYLCAHAESLHLYSYIFNAKEICWYSCDMMHISMWVYQVKENRQMEPHDYLRLFRDHAERLLENCPRERSSRCEFCDSFLFIYFLTLGLKAGSCMIMKSWRGVRLLKHHYNHRI